MAVAGGLFTALTFAEASLPGLDLGTTSFVLPLVLGTGLFTGLNTLALNRRMSVSSDARKAELLAFPPQPGAGWIVVVRDRKDAARSIGFDVSVDGEVIAQLMPKHFTMIVLPAGAHRLFVDIPGAPGPSAVAPLDIAVTQGAILIFAIRTSMGLLRTSPRLEPVADAPATRAMLARMRLVEPQRP